MNATKKETHKIRKIRSVSLLRHNFTESIAGYNDYNVSML